MTSFTWATKRLLSLKTAFDPDEENEWAFGQIFPVILLAAPIAALIDNWPSMPRPTAKDGHNDNLNDTEGNNADNHRNSSQNDGTNDTSSADQDTSHETSHETNHNTDQITDNSMNNDANGKNVPGAEPALLARQESCQWTDRDYESGISFRVGSLIVGISYVYLAILVLITDAENLLDLFSHLAFSFFCFYPALQGAWFLSALWIQKLGLKTRHQLAILEIVVVTIMLVMMIEMSGLFYGTPLVRTSTDGPGRFRSSFVAPSLSLAMLAEVYILFGGWFYLTLQAEQLQDINRTYIRRIDPQYLPIAGGICVVGIQFATFFSWSPWLDYATEMPMVIVLQGQIQLAEAFLQPSRHSAVRVIFMFLWLILSQVLPWIFFATSFTIIFHSFTYWPFWLTFWLCYEKIGQRVGQQAREDNVTT